MMVMTETNHPEGHIIKEDANLTPWTDPKRLCIEEDNDWLENMEKEKLLQNFAFLPIEDQSAIISRSGGVYKSVIGVNQASLKGEALEDKIIMGDNKNDETKQRNDVNDEGDLMPETVLAKAEQFYPNVDILLIGDFNARIGSDSQVAPEQMTSDEEDRDVGDVETVSPGHHGKYLCTPEEASEDDEEVVDTVGPRPRDPERLPPDVNMGDLTEAERAAVSMARRRRVSALEHVGAELADQAREEARDVKRAEQRRHEEVLVELRACRAGDPENREERRAMRCFMEMSSSAIIHLMHAVTQLVEAVRLHDPVAEPPQAATRTVGPGAAMAEPPWVAASTVGPGEAVAMAKAPWADAGTVGPGAAVAKLPRATPSSTGPGAAMAEPGRAGSSTVAHGLPGLSPCRRAAALQAQGLPGQSVDQKAPLPRKSRHSAAPKGHHAKGRGHGPIPLPNDSGAAPSPPTAAKLLNLALGNQHIPFKPQHCG
ncbi:UNVERIFIED_CONTAM: hypothetical protein K2H54_015961 [Gekko kuhli]